MRRGLTVVLALLVVLPLVLLAGLGLRVARNEQALMERQVVLLLESRLRDIDQRIQRLLEQRARTLLELTDDLPYHDPDRFRQIVRTNPLIEQLFVQATDGRLLFPPLADGISDSERDFLQRTRTIFTERLLWHAGNDREAIVPNLPAASPPIPRGRPVPQRKTAMQSLQMQQADQQQQALAGQLPQQQSLLRADHGWFAWYWDTGVHLLFWRHDGRDRIVGAELSRMRLLSDIINELPADLPDQSSAAVVNQKIVMLDSRDRVVYQWGAGAGRGKGGSGTAVQVALSAPLGAWRLRLEHGGELATGGAATLLAGLAVFIAVTGVLVGLSLYFHRESTREWREARQRVRFVNQVSHELRSPLTNIRLYAELLEQRLDESDVKTREHLGVIVSESHRLSRLIGNVLTFARHRRGQLSLQRSSGVIDDTVAAVVEQFRPSLEGKGMTIQVAAGGPPQLSYDADAIEQVLANLLNNVEKYAATGGLVTITTTLDDGRCLVTIADRGPGIPADREQAVFEPFVRLSDRLSEGVSGTGMGLGISRDLARLHGGDLRLVPTPEGACFELILPLDDGYRTMGRPGG